MDENTTIQTKSQRKTSEIKEILTNLEDGVYEVYPNVNGLSEVWKQFSLIKHSETSRRIDYVQCIECRGLLQFKDLSGTSHLLRHKCHFPQELENGSSKFRELASAKMEEAQGILMKNIIKLCTTDFYSYESVCGSTNFLEFMQSLVSLGHKFGNVEVKIIYPNVNSVRRETRSKKEDYDRENYIKFREARKFGFCSATVETRKYMCTTEINLLVMSFQYIDKDLTELKKKTIFTTSYDVDDHESVKQNIADGFASFGGDENDLIDLIVVCPKSTALDEALTYPFLKKDCIASTIIEIIDDSFEKALKIEMKELLSNCKEAVGIISLNGQYNLELSQDVGTWVSKLAMLHSVINRYDDIVVILKNENKNRLVVNKRRAEEMKSFLEPFVEAINELSATTYTTANKVLLWWAYLKAHLKTHNNYTSEIKALMITIDTQFDYKFRPTMSNKVDCFLDPRYKFLKMLTETEKNEVFKEVRRLLDEIVIDDELVEKTSSGPDPKKGRFSSYEGNKNDAKKHKKPDSEKPKSRFSRFESNESDLQKEDEVSKYINLPPTTSASFTSEFDVITKFWKPRKKTLPKLFQLVTTRLHFPACCGNVWENTFKMKENLNADTVNELLIVKDNF